MADLALVEQAASLDLVGGKLAAGGEPVHLLRLATQDRGEFVDGEEGWQRPLRIHSGGTISGPSDGTRPRTPIECP